MSATALADAQEGFAGGWSLNNSIRMAPNQYASALNARITGDGDLSTRQGCQRYTATPIGGSNQPIFGGFSWRQSNQLSDLIVSNGHLFTAFVNAASGGSPGYTIVTDQGDGLNNVAGGPYTIFHNPRPSFAHFRDATSECVYIADGQTTDGGGRLFPLSKWNGTTWTPHGFGPSGIPFSYIWVYNQRLFGVTGADQIVYWSALNDGDTLGNVAAGGGFATVRTFGAQSLIGGAALGDTNFLWHRGAISLFRGTAFDDINIQAGAIGLAGDIGICSPFAFVPFDGYALMLTDRGVYLLTSTGSLIALDKPSAPDPTIRDTAFVGGMASFGMFNWAVHNARYQEIWFGTSEMQSDATHFPVYVYNYRFSCWSSKFGFVLPASTSISAVWETLDLTGVPQVIMGCSDGYPRSTDWPVGSSVEMYVDDMHSDRTAGTVFSASTQCRRLWTGDQPSTKQWRETEIAATLNGNTTLQLTPTIQGATLAAIPIQQPAYLANGKPGYYHVATGGDSQYMDAALAWQSTPKLSLHRVEANVKGLGNRGVGRPDATTVGTQPNAVSGLVLWLKADALELNDGAQVASWPDASTSGNTATQATAGARPTYHISVVNGKPVVRFDGIDDELSLTSNITGTAISAFLVLNKASTGAGAWGVLRLDDIEIQSRFSAAGNVWGSWENTESSTGSAIMTNFAVLAMVHRARNDIDYTTNGVLVNRTPPLTGPVGPPVNESVGSNNGSQFHAGDIAEVIVYNRALSTTERRGVEQYLGAKYGIAV